MRRRCTLALVLLVTPACGSEDPIELREGEWTLTTTSEKRDDTCGPQVAAVLPDGAFALTKSEDAFRLDNGVTGFDCTLDEDLAFACSEALSVDVTVLEDGSELQFTLDVEGRIVADGQGEGEYVWSGACVSGPCPTVPCGYRFDFEMTLGS